MKGVAARSPKKKHSPKKGLPTKVTRKLFPAFLGRRPTSPIETSKRLKRSASEPTPRADRMIWARKKRREEEIEVESFVPRMDDQQLTMEAPRSAKHDNKVAISEEAPRTTLDEDCLVLTRARVGRDDGRDGARKGEETSSTSDVIDDLQCGTSELNAGEKSASHECVGKNSGGCPQCADSMLSPIDDDEKGNGVDGECSGCVDTLPHRIRVGFLPGSPITPKKRNMFEEGKHKSESNMYSCQDKLECAGQGEAPMLIGEETLLVSVAVASNSVVNSSDLGKPDALEGDTRESSGREDEVVGSNVLSRTTESGDCISTESDGLNFSWIDGATVNSGSFGESDFDDQFFDAHFVDQELDVQRSILFPNDESLIFLEATEARVVEYTPDHCFEQIELDFVAPQDVAIDCATHADDYPLEQSSSRKWFPRSDQEHAQTIEASAQDGRGDDILDANFNGADSDQFLSHLDESRQGGDINTFMQSKDSRKEQEDGLWGTFQTDCEHKAQGHIGEHGLLHGLRPPEVPQLAIDLRSCQAELISRPLSDCKRCEVDSNIPSNHGDGTTNCAPPILPRKSCHRFRKPLIGGIWILGWCIATAAVYASSSGSFLWLQSFYSQNGDGRAIDDSLCLGVWRTLERNCNLLIASRENGSAFDSLAAQHHISPLTKSDVLAGCEFEIALHQQTESGSQGLTRTLGTGNSNEDIWSAIHADMLSANPDYVPMPHEPPFEHYLFGLAFTFLAVALLRYDSHA